jgi:hypothetical protein
MPEILVSYWAASAWNNMPNEVVNGYNQLSTLKSFKPIINNYFSELEKRGLTKEKRGLTRTGFA